MPPSDLMGGEGYDEDLDDEGEPSHGNNNGRRGGGRGRGRGAVKGSGAAAAGAAAAAAAAAAGGSDDAAHARQRQAHDRHTARSVQDITLPDAGIAELMDRYAEEAGIVFQCPFRGCPFAASHHTFSLNLRLNRGKYVLFIGCER